jgi:hypothetical protein
MKRIGIAAALSLAFAPGAHAVVPVEDIPALGQLVQTLAVAKQQADGIFGTLRAIKNIPQDLMQQASGLLSLGVQNPLSDLEGTLHSILNGGPLTGSCASAAGDYLTSNRYGLATGNDISAAWVNVNSAQLGGVVSCLQTEMKATQTRLNEMPQLLDEMQSCQDISCTTAVGGRIQLETATIAAQTNQTIMMGQAAQFQRWTTEDQVIQKMRRDSEETAAGTAGGGSLQSGSVLTATPEAQPFTASGG